ncbi:Glycogen synthase [uncultured archaeon]|nr:Glycogen synthase [uncultured archaeon]
MESKAEMCFEVSWEVCNKVGGIFTVVQSKILPMQEYYGAGYFLVGPYFPKKAWGIFEERLPPDECRSAFERLKKEGIDVHFGTWITKGNPDVFLVDFTNFSAQKDDIKRNLWDWYQIDSLSTEWFDFDEPVTWAYAVGRLLEELSHVYDKRIVAQFHEWLAGAALLYLRHNKVKIGTVFTTHATTLGRALAMLERDIYEQLESIDSDNEAKRLGPSVWAKHLLEKQSAQNAHVFTTVSEITGIEAEHFLGRKPDVLLFNGLDMSKFPSFEDASLKHKLFKNRIKQFLMYYFFPYYNFDIDNTLIYFIAGRYEFHDKGVDVFIKALGRLNDQLKEEKCEKTIVAFFWIPGNIKSIRPELLESRSYFSDIKDSIDDVHEDVHNRLLYMLMAGKEVSKELLFGDDFLQDLKPKLKRLSKQGVPPIATHFLYDENKDAIMTSLIDAGLDNAQDDVVKVVFYPIYLSGADGLLDTSYYESMQGSHLGVFPSYYEPWGYTPLEAAALGVSSLTTDLSGFGQYIRKECAQQKYPGVFVLPRFKKSTEEIVAALTDMMSRFAHFTTKERIENKIVAQKMAASADWKLFIKNYIEAHNKAVEKL